MHSGSQEPAICSKLRKSGKRLSIQGNQFIAEGENDNLESNARQGVTTCPGKL